MRDHVGLVAGLFDARGRGAVRDRAPRPPPAPRIVTTGAAVHAMVRNGLGCVRQPRARVPRWCQDNPTARRRAPVLSDAPHLPDEALGRAVETRAAAGITARSRLLAATAAERLGLAPRLAPLDRPSGQVDGRSQRDNAPDDQGVHSPRGARRDPRPVLPHVMLAWLVEHPAGIAVRMTPRRGHHRAAPACGQVVRAHAGAVAHSRRPPRPGGRACPRARGHPANALGDSPAMAPPGPSDLERSASRPSPG